jgi:hypothetical protein
MPSRPPPRQPPHVDHHLDDPHHLDIDHDRDTAMTTTTPCIDNAMSPPRSRGDGGARKRTTTRRTGRDTAGAKRGPMWGTTRGVGKHAKTTRGQSDPRVDHERDGVHPTRRFVTTPPSPLLKNM